MMAVPFAVRQTAGFSELNSRVPQPSGVGNEFHYVANETYMTNRRYYYLAIEKVDISLNDYTLVIVQC